MRVRHSTFRESTGTAIRQTVKRDWLHDIEYPACEVRWDKPWDRSVLDTIMANYNLIFIVPAVTRSE